MSQSASSRADEVTVGFRQGRPRPTFLLGPASLAAIGYAAVSGSDQSYTADNLDQTGSSVTVLVLTSSLSSWCHGGCLDTGGSYSVR